MIQLQDIEQAMTVKLDDFYLKNYFSRRHSPRT